MKTKLLKLVKTGIFISIMLFGQNALGQDGTTLTGIIRDHKSGESLPYVNIGILTSGKGTTSNVDGHFTLFGIPSDTSTIVVSYLGYSPQYIKLSGDVFKNGLSVKLEKKSINLKVFEVKSKKEKLVESSKEISKITINPAQLSNLPNLGEEDIFRTIQLLPGVSGSTENSGLYVRGGTPDQNLVLLDGITVYYVDHFFGMFSAFNANAIKDVQVYKGGFGAKYGGRVSSVVDMTAKSGNRNNMSFGLGANLLSSNFIVESPIFKGKGSFMLAGRRSYTDIIQSPTYTRIFENVTEENDDPLGFGILANNAIDPVFHFYDLNGKVTLFPTEEDVISLNFYTGKDELDNSRVEDFGLGGFGLGGTRLETTDLTNWGNNGASLKWSRKWSPKLYSNLISSYSQYFSDFTLINEFFIDTFSFRLSTLQDNNVQDFTTRLDNELKINEDWQLDFGAWVTYNDIKYLNQLDDTIILQDRHNWAMQSALYTQAKYSLTDDIELNFGLRGTHYDATNNFYVEPRASAYYQFTDKIRLKGAWGIYKQFINRVILEDVFSGSRDFWLLADTGLLPVVTANHYIAGITYENDDLLFDVEVYQKDMTGLLEYTLRFSTLEQIGGEQADLFYQGTGSARGLDFLLQKKFGIFTGWLAYTLGEVMHNFPDINNGKTFPALHDTRHEAKAVASLQLGRFNLAGTFVYATGRPFTQPIGRYSITLLDGHETEFVHVGDKNSSRLPDYHRLDIALSYKHKFEKGELTTGISGFNIYNRENIKYKRFQLLEFDPQTFEPIEPELVTTDIKLLGFVPNFFIKVKF
ncbi:MAG: TonB-dependent receptor [Flavobacteriales bacterium]|nr:TonB-dependent receptor [Flavobacteriales bacterium]